MEEKCHWPPRAVQTPRSLSVLATRLGMPPACREWEVGEVANAVQVFKVNALERLRLMKEGSEERDNSPSTAGQRCASWPTISRLL